MTGTQIRSSWKIRITMSDPSLNMYDIFQLKVECEIFATMFLKFPIYYFRRMQYSLLCRSI